MDSDPINLQSEEDREQVREELDLLHDFHEADDFKWVLSDVRGRRFIWGLLEEAGVYSSSFDGSAETTIFNEGNRNQGLKILSMIHEVAPDMYATMIKEKKDYERHISDIQRNGRDSS